jgi:hypothetical protein
MNKDNFQNILKEYIPEYAIGGIIAILDKYPIHIKITKERLTKQGDFRILRNGQAQISINHNLNSYQFLLTLVHELAHWLTHKKYKTVKPHGIEWKHEFKYLMLPFLNNDIFPNDTLPYLAQYLKNPKAATGSDVQLSIALKKYDAPSDTISLFELEKGNRFKLRNKNFILGEKRRTRYECLEQNNNRKYLIHQNAEVKPI